ncbi:hypothetical protein BME24068_04003 [Burkholderia metallica]|nr:hypothetical protein BME24068_04003 [Burkholderia metallica]
MLICASRPLRWSARRAFPAGWRVEVVKKCYGVMNLFTIMHFRICLIDYFRRGGNAAVFAEGTNQSGRRDLLLLRACGGGGVKNAGRASAATFPNRQISGATMCPRAPKRRRKKGGNKCVGCATFGSRMHVGAILRRVRWRGFERVSGPHSTGNGVRAMQIRRTRTTEVRTERDTRRGARNRPNASITACRAAARPDAGRCDCPRPDRAGIQPASPFRSPITLPDRST